MGNFLLVQVANATVGEAADPALAVYERLLRAGVIVRPVGNYGLAGWLRVSIGLAEENAVFLAALGGALGR
jgi:histidinol-phosphate aminotransferase